MQTNITELVFILDRSGSMGGLESDTIGGFNAMLAKQKAEAGECRITTVLFDNEYEILHDRLDLKAVETITDADYYVRGNTALLDAIGKTINKIRGVQAHTAEEYRADKVLVVITTDGLENASREYNYKTVKKLIEQQKAKHNWEFIFLGANIDSAEVAESIGIDRSRSHNWKADSAGVKSHFAAVSTLTSTYRSGAGILKDWASKLESDPDENE
jgi:uncharacterized protein YegL